MPRRGAWPLPSSRRGLRSGEPVRGHAPTHFPYVATDAALGTVPVRPRRSEPWAHPTCSVDTRPGGHARPGPPPPWSRSPVRSLRRRPNSEPCSAREDVRVRSARLALTIRSTSSPSPASRAERHRSRISASWCRTSHRVPTTGSARSNQPRSNGRVGVPTGAVSGGGRSDAVKPTPPRTAPRSRRSDRAVASVRRRCRAASANRRATRARAALPRARRSRRSP